MAVEYKPSNTKAELLEIAVVNGVSVSDEMTKAQIVAVLDAQSGTENVKALEVTTIASDVEQPTRCAQDGTDDMSEYTMFIYAGPSLPNGRLKENAVFRGTIEDVKNYLADVLEDYPQAAKLIVPTCKIAAFSVKVKTAGNVANKYYNDIVSTMRNHKEA